MWLLQMCLLGSVTFGVFGMRTQHKYKVVQEQLMFDYINDTMVDITGEVSTVNATTNVLNLTVIVKLALPDNSKFLITVARWVKGEYRFGFLTIQKSIKDVFDMEMFDLQTLWLQSCKPPITWPIEPGVTYHAEWNPDSTKFPPNVPEGRYKVRIDISVNKVLAITANWFVRGVNI